MEPVAVYALAGAIGAAIFLQVFVAQVWSRRMIHQVRGTATTEHSFALPYFGHLIQLLIFGDGFLQQARDSASGAGWFRIRLLGQTYNIVYDPLLITATKALKSPSLQSDTTTLQIFENLLSLPPQPAALDAALKLAYQPSDPSVQQATTAALVKSFQLNLPDLLSYMSNLIDQSPWERETLVSISEDHETATVAFHELMRNFTTYHILATLLPHHLLEAHPHARTLIADLWKVHAASFLLALGLPRWAPVPRLTAAHIARRNLLRSLTGLLAALDELDAGREPADAEWQNLDAEDVSPFLRDFQRSFKAAPPGARASLLLARLLALCVQVAELAFWTIAHLSFTTFATTTTAAAAAADGVVPLLEQLRAETASAARTTQPPSAFGISEPVRLALDAGALARCGTLQAAYLETVRLYDRSIDVSYVGSGAGAGVALPRAGGASGSSAGSRLKLDAGSGVVTVPHLHNTSEVEFLHPRKWWPERHLDVDSVDDGEVFVPDGLFAALAGGGGGGPDARGGEERGQMVREVVTALVAGFVAVWDVKLDEGVPDAKSSVSVTGPQGDVRAEVRRRELRVPEKRG